MGCLLEFIFDVIIEGWFHLMQLIVPRRKICRELRIVLKVIVGAFSILLFDFMFMGIFALLSADEYTRQIGKYMVFIPLGISAVQIVLGLIAHRLRKK